MAVKVKEYLKYLRQKSYPSLLDEEVLRRLGKVEQVFGEVETGESILEVCLSRPEKTCDYSIRVDVDSPFLKEYWYELDSQACAGEEDYIAPCYFVDASQVVPGKDNRRFYETVLVKMAGRERVEKLRKNLEHCVEKLQGRCDCLFQLGAMNARGELDSLRLFTDDMKAADLVCYLKELGWKGDTNALRVFLETWEAYSDQRKFILDFDLYEQGISEKIGINFGTTGKDPAIIESFLEALQEAKLCTLEKKEEVMRFIHRFPSHTPFIQNDISHFKIPFKGALPLMAKAYLRQGSECFWPGFRAWDTPVLMNLELTTRCPLRCPQCYCDLTKGKDLDLQKALYWMEEAAKNGIRTVNLSGGETLLYPHLLTLIRACHERGMEANAALSGYGVTKEVLTEMIECGIGEICVSLNGSREEINRKSRDGYELAVHTLELLKELKYPRTNINWVMHSYNADDLEQMILLAEKYEADSLTVMVFKPDASCRLPSVPSKEQVLQAAAWIKAYKGRVQIEVEECFSQLRAVLGKRFLTNLNRGISRGCGAGRDGISINVDGRITPCRHLELAEEFQTIREYWEESQILKQLREAEDRMQAPCTQCSYQKYCLPCMAVNWKMEGQLYMGDPACPIRPQ